MLFPLQADELSWRVFAGAVLDTAHKTGKTLRYGRTGNEFEEFVTPAAESLRAPLARNDDKTFPASGNQAGLPAVAWRCAETVIGGRFSIKKLLPRSVLQFDKAPLETDALLREIRLDHLQIKEPIRYFAALNCVTHVPGRSQQFRLMTRRALWKRNRLVRPG